MSIGSITFKRNTDRNTIARMGSVHRRLFNRLKSWNPTVRQGSGLREQRADPHEFLKYLLTDPDVDPVDVANALVDLRDRGFVEVEVTDDAAFRHEMTEVAREILMERESNDD